MPKAINLATNLDDTFLFFSPVLQSCEVISKISDHHYTIDLIHKLTDGFFWLWHQYVELLR